MKTLLEEVTASGKYAAVCEETILRVCNEMQGRYKSQKDAAKAVKTALHRITGAFMPLAELKRARELFDAPGQLLGLHVSARERLSFYAEMLQDILCVTGSPKSIVDIACGLNPVAVLLAEGFGAASYEALDINLPMLDLLNAYFAHHGLNGKASAMDALCSVPKGTYDLGFLLKLLPLLEQQKKGHSKALLQALACRYLAVSFPTKTLSGKNVGMYGHYLGFMQDLLNELPYECVLEKEYKNELLFVLRSKAAP